MTPPVNALIAAREHLTNRRDEQVDWQAVDFIDAQLSQVPPGDDNRVDLLLGRSCAVLPDYEVKPGWYVAPAVVSMRPETIALIEATRLIFEAAEPIEY